MTKSKYITPGVLGSPGIIWIQDLCSDIDKMVNESLEVEGYSLDDNAVEDDLIALNKTIANLQMHVHCIQFAYELLPSCDEAGVILQAKIHKFAEDYKAYPELLYEQLHIMHHCDTSSCLDLVLLNEKERVKLELDIKENGYND